MALSLSSLSTPPLCHNLLAAGFHSSPWSYLPDKKQKATIEKAVDIAKEKKKKGVDTLTKVSTVCLACSNYSVAFSSDTVKSRTNNTVITLM